jgi:hypothetical protein
MWLNCDIICTVFFHIHIMNCKRKLLIACVVSLAIGFLLGIGFVQSTFLKAELYPFDSGMGQLVPTESNCKDNVDNDGDAFVDCNDSDCIDDPNCGAVEICNDTIDNDGDAFVDCNDSDCIDDPAC